MSKDTDRSGINGLLGLAPESPTKKKFGTAKPGKKALPVKKKVKEKKIPFTSTITEENKRRLDNYQSRKPGGSPTTDVLNQALKKFFDANRQYADDIESDESENPADEA